MKPISNLSGGYEVWLCKSPEKKSSKVLNFRGSRKSTEMSWEVPLKQTPFGGPSNNALSVEDSTKSPRLYQSTVFFFESLSRKIMPEVSATSPTNPILIKKLSFLSGRDIRVGYHGAIFD